MTRKFSRIGRGVSKTIIAAALLVSSAAMADHGGPHIIYSGNGCPAGTLNPVLQYNFLHFYPTHLDATVGPQVPAEENQKTCTMELQSDGAWYEFAVKVEVLRGDVNLEEGVDAIITATSTVPGKSDIEVGQFVTSGPSKSAFSFNTAPTDLVWSECAEGGGVNIRTDVQLTGEGTVNNAITIKGPVVYKVYLRRC